MRNIHFTTLLLFLSIVVFSCKDQPSTNTESSETTEEQSIISKPVFNADSAYAYIQTQVDFGPRVPGTAAQRKAATWMQQRLADFCDTVYVQDVKVRAGNGSMLPCINLIGSIHPTAGKRILLLAHWDSRPWADRDVKDTDKPIVAADDGGSGVGVLLELARQIKSQPIPADLGIDIFFTDVEDYGKTEWGDDSYALGTQYWAKNPHVPGYTASFGILLDMVGARDARFPLEGISTKFAGNIQQNIWKAAGRAGYSSYFPFTAGGYITDDHAYINELTRIPTVDIINLSTNTESPFAPHWHTHNDNMSIIDKATLKAVGETLLQVIYELAHDMKAS